jgi:hypothetical protein
MATAEASLASALVTASQRPGRTASPPPQSKRDKKRQALTDKLDVLKEQYHKDRDRSYREELGRIQIDVNLVAKVDPYAPRPLDVVEREFREISQAGTDRTNRSLLEMAGPSFDDWHHQVEDLVEHRDYELTTQTLEYKRNLQVHHNTHAYKIELARREHRALSATLRDRLINTISSKKARLSKEKEALDIADGNALLLHPNQFSLTHPSSPGGNHGKRSTRLRREIDDHTQGLSENKKRKRHAAEDDGSPVPSRRALDPNNTTPLWQNDRIRAMRKETGPVYSIDKLFTDKELSMTYNAAALASYKHLLTRRDASGNVIPPPDDSEAGNGDLSDERDRDEDLYAPVMDRVPSHATRSTRGGQNNNNSNHNFYDEKVLGIDGLANFELAGNLDRMDTQEPKLPPLIHSQYSKAYVKSDSNTPTPLSIDDANQDLMVMKVFKHYQSSHGAGSNLDVAGGNGGRRLLEAAVPQTNGSGKYVAYLQSNPRPSVEQLSESLGVPTSALQNETPLAGNVLSSMAPGVVSANHASPAPPMSRQSSFGGVAMSRTGSGRGGRRRG